MNNHSCPESLTTSQDETSAASLRKLYLAIGLCAVFMVVELVGGWWANSLAIISDAVHLLSGNLHTANLRRNYFILS
jgi:Co/Zn/Cd efflux system component